MNVAILVLVSSKYVWCAVMLKYWQGHMTRPKCSFNGLYQQSACVLLAFGVCRRQIKSVNHHSISDRGCQHANKRSYIYVYAHTAHKQTPQHWVLIPLRCEICVLREAQV
jgi:hypothetical protein